MSTPEPQPQVVYQFTAWADGYVTKAQPEEEEDVE